MAEKIKFAWTERSEISEGAFAVVKKLRDAGHAAYFAGGAVRDALLKRPVKEIDIATSATPTQVKRLFKKSIPTGEKHGTVTIWEKNHGYEVTTFRNEGPYLDSRRPSNVKFIRSAEMDAQRRDLTINALFYNPETSEIIDYVSGLADLKKKVIRFVGDSEKRIREDALRLMRAVRIAVILDFELSRDARRAIQKCAPLIKKISAERVKSELDKIMLSSRSSVGIGYLDILGLTKYILPELKSLQGVKQPKNQHSEGDVYAHTLLCLDEIAPEFDLPTRYALLFHDLGKAETKKIRNGKITFYNHTEAGAKLALSICKRLKFSKADTEKIIWLARYHMVPNDFFNMKLATRRKWGLSPHFADLLSLFRADAAASLHLSGRANRNPAAYREGIKILNELQSKPQLKKPLLSGNEIMKTLRLTEGPLVGKILRHLEEKKLSGEIASRLQAKNYLKKNKKTLDKILSTS